MQISRAGKKATLQQHQMEIGYICLFICKYYLPRPPPPMTPLCPHIHMYANIWQLLCAVFVADAIASGGIYKKEKNTAKNTFVFFGNFQFKL